MFSVNSPLILSRMTFREVEVRSRTAMFVMLMSLALAVSGCGGAQNPVRISIHVPRILTGFWDGLTILIGFVATLIDPNKYGIIAVHRGLGYIIGYVVGVLLLLYLCYGGRSYYRRRTTIVR
jgi:hypothetical protein